MARNPFYRSLPSYEDIKSKNPFRMALHEPGFSRRAIIDKGDGFYDVMMGWRYDDHVGWCEDDGSIIFGDIGGQMEIGWNPDQGHGSIWRLRPDDTLEAIMPPDPEWKGTVFEPRLAPAHFGQWGGHTFFVGQTLPGRVGATHPHAVYRVPPGGGAPELFCVVPNNGRIGGGVPGALMPGTFGRKGTPFEGVLFVQSFMNCTVYKVTADRKIVPFLTLDLPEGTIMPQMVINAPTWWKEQAGELVMFGARGASFESARVAEKSYGYWRIQPDGSLDPIDAPIAPIRAQIAPKEFGPFGGHLFYVEEGPVNLAQVAGCDEHQDGMPYLGRVIRLSPDGEKHIFADEFQGSYTSLCFDKNRLVMGVVGLSYSTGEHHEPDGAVYEIRWDGDGEKRR